MSEPGSAKTVRGDESAGNEAPTGVGRSEQSVAAATEPEAGPEAAESAQPRRPRPTGRPWWLRHYTFMGTTVGLIFSLMTLLLAAPGLAVILWEGLRRSQVAVADG